MNVPMRLGLGRTVRLLGIAAMPASFRTLAGLVALLVAAAVLLYPAAGVSAQSPSADAELSALTVNTVSVAGFAADTTFYQFGVASTVTTATLAPTTIDSGASEAYSTQRAANTPATGAPAITGVAQVGQPLTASTTGIADADGLTNVSYIYQWVRNDGTADAAISGATASTYTLVGDDVGKTIKVSVSFTDDAGNAESLTSAATAEVTQPEPLDGVVKGAMTVGAMTYSGTAVRGYATRGGGMGAFEITAAADPTDVGGYGDVRLVMHAPGEMSLPGVGEVADSLTFGYAADLATPFTLLLGDVQLSSAHAVNSDGDTAPIGRFWVWEDVTPGWDVGDEVTVRVTDADELLAGTEPIWRSKLTVGVFGTLTWGYLGFQDRGAPSSVVGELAPRSVTVDGEFYEFLILAYYQGSRRSTDGSLYTEALDFYAWDKVIPSEWVLTVNGDSFRVGDTYSGFLIGTYLWERHQYKVAWIYPGIAFELGAIYPVTLSRPTNTPATGAPAISGTAQVGETLTASTTGIADEDGLTNVSYTYQWVRNDGTDDSDIGGATASAYTLAASDQGKTIKVRVSFTDDAGNAESLTSAATAEVGFATSQQNAANPPATGAPTISGAAQVGETLTASTTGIADTDGLTSVSYTYQWVRNDGTDDSDIGGATASAYTLVADDAGNTIKVRVDFTDDAGNAESLTSGATAAVPLPLTASSHDVPASHDGSASFTFELRFSEEVPLGYVKVRDDALTVSGGEVVNARRLQRPANIRWEITIRPDGNGDVTVVLPVTTDCAAQGAICTGDDRKLSNELTVTVAGPPSNIPATGAPAISGTARVGQTLTASASGIADSDGLTNVSYTYQWVRNDGTDDSDISGATGSAYTLAAADQGKTIKVRVSFTDDGGNAESLTSTATAAVEARPNTPATGMASISGTARVGETLTASASGIADSDGLTNVSYTYQWVRNDGTDDSDISGATGSAYTLAAADQGKTIKVRVSFTDDGGNAESLTSTATAAVEARPNTPATGMASIRGTARVGETLTASASGIADSDGLTNVSYTYQWVRNDGTDDSDISGATGSAYTLAAADQGKTIKVRVSFTDDGGNAESLTSTATAAVEARSNTPATGMVSIRGTARVGETLTASASGIADSDGLTNVSYTYQWVRNDGTDDSDISGATGSAYTLAAADQGKTIKVRVSFTDDGGNAESLTSTATGSVAAAWLLTASAQYAPASHDGSSTFIFQLRFSEEPRSDFSYKTLRDHAFSVTGGEVIKARRLQRPGNIRWEITISPDGAGTVTIVLPPTTDCDAQGAICTGDGRMLSGRLQITVSGPNG